MKPKRIYRGEDFWRKTIPEYRKSGISQVEFCNRRELPINTFRRWLYEFNREAAPTSSTPGFQASGSADGVPLFMPVKLKKAAVESAYPMEIILSNGRCIRVAPDASPEAVRGMVRMLEGA